MFQLPVLDGLVGLLLNSVLTLKQREEEPVSGGRPSGRVTDEMHCPTCSMLHVECTDPTMGSAPHVCAAGLWAVTSPRRRTLCECWGIAGRCSPDRLSLVL